MSDEVLMRIAKNPPENLKSLKAITEMPQRLADHSGMDILSELRDSENAEPCTLLDANLPLERPDKKSLQALQERVRLRAETLGIQDEVLDTRKEMEELLLGRPSGRIHSGWRQIELEQFITET